MTDDAHFSARRSFFRRALELGAGAVIYQLSPSVTPAVQAGVSAPSIINCTTWGARAPTEPITLLASRPTKIIVHHTSDPNTTDYSLSRAYQLARSTQQAHFNRGWIDTGQQFTISRGGYVLEGRHRSLEALNGGASHVRGAHCEGQNDVAVGIENEGTYNSVSPPQALYGQLVTLCAYICQQYAIPASQIYGHRDFNATDCPGTILYSMLPQLRNDVAARVGGAVRAWPTVQRGQSGERVKTVQYLLRARGYSLTVDGAFGSGTEGAVTQFQSSRSLSADGIVGSQTWEALIITTRRGDQGDTVRAIQSQLVSKGYALSVDGAFGSGTESAVKQFQTARGLSSDGVVGPDTWSALVG
jgi:N-acetyl-anhydromuramyl-L-alanine amidase AmpD